MQFTLTLSAWMVPAGVTCLWIIAVMLAGFCERNDTGLVSGFWTMAILTFGFIAVVVQWITFVLVRWLS